MTLSDWLWICTAAYTLHAFEEFELDWRDWARAIIKLPVEWHDFYVVNFSVIVLGFIAANLAPGLPWLALSFPALMLINATFFHLAPMVWTGGRYSPGAATAAVFFYPIGIATYWSAANAGVLDVSAVVGSFVVGAALMAMPIVLLHIKSRPYFRQMQP
jgi:hypothetical protein